MTPTQDAARTAALAVLLQAGADSGDLAVALETLWQDAGTDGAQRAGDAAAATPSLTALAASSADTANGLSFAYLYELADRISAQAVAGGGEDELASVATDVLDERSSLIADFEWAQAENAAATDVFTANGVTRLSWVGGGCPLCEENAGMGDIDIGDSWPNGSPPVHPGCGCSVEEA